VSILCAGVLFLNALLLFWVQPLFAKMLLPMLGGSPSVWTACMLFFQAALLAGYAYSHVGLERLGVRRQALIHSVIVWLPLLVMPFAVAGQAASASDNPIWWLLWTLATRVGLPFVVLASTAPLVQRWFSIARRDASDPYWLYAASNAGSLASLITFPTVLEPLIPLRQQTAIWSIGYAIVAALLTSCAVMVIRRGGDAALAAPEQTVANEDRPTMRRRLRWLAVAFVPSSLMLGVTTYLSTDVAAVPLLWVLPLSCYLLTFIVAFGWNPNTTSAVARRLLGPALLPLVLIVIADVPLKLWVLVPLHLVAFAVLALWCHSELARDRPGVRHLTEFYLWLAAGGVLGGAFNTIIAPQIFTSVAEYPIAIALGCALGLSLEQLRELARDPRRLSRPALAVGITIAVLLGEHFTLVTRPVVVILLGVPIVISSRTARDTARLAIVVIGLLGAFMIGNAFMPTGGGSVLHAERTFFGVYRVRTDPAAHMVTLMHGTTIHGAEVVGHVNPEPLTYYYRGGPISQVFSARGDNARSVGVIGLGAGSLAAYARPGSSWVFYEIDAAVERLARDTRFFHYLGRCGTQCRVVIGDARLSLASAAAVHDVLVLDAFSSDAIPLHLLTSQALQTYESHLAPDGLLVVHISNRHIRLRPVVARLAREQGLTAFARFDGSADQSRGYQNSEWVVMARTADALESFRHDSQWTALKADTRPAWSDDFSNIWTELR
jgi:hypothetical protein